MLSLNDKPHILVVDDNKMMRLMFSDMLEISGFNVHVAENAAEALGILEAEQNLDAVLTDIEMPGSMNGIDLAAKILTKWPDKAVLVTSGGVKPYVGQLPAGVGFIPKPFRRIDLVQQLHGLLTRH